MKAYLLQLGTIHTDANTLVSNFTRANASEPNRAAIWEAIPVWAVLIETEKHRIMYDLGCLPDAMEGGWSKTLQGNMPITRKPEEYIEKQLELIGLTPADIDTVILSHLHADHFGGIEQFTHCDVYVPKEDWVNALIKNHENPVPFNGGSYIKRCVEAPVKQYHPISVGDDFELFPGIEIITLPGHTANLLGLVLHMPGEGTMIFPSDAVSSSLNYGPPVRPGPAYDNQAFVQSIEKVRRLANRYQAKVMISHDMRLYEGYKKAPDFYA